MLYSQKYISYVCFLDWRCCCYYYSADNKINRSAIFVRASLILAICLHQKLLYLFYLLILQNTQSTTINNSFIFFFSLFFHYLQAPPPPPPKSQQPHPKSATTQTQTHQITLNCQPEKITSLSDPTRDGNFCPTRGYPARLDSNGPDFTRSD